MKGNLFLCSIANFFAAASIPVDLGTTLVAIKHRSGVVVAADSTTSVGGYVSHRYAHKIATVSDTTVICRSGSAADTQQLAEEVRHQNLQRWQRYGTELTVSQIAHWLRFLVCQGSGLRNVGLLVAGYDLFSNKPRIFSVAPSGALLEEDWCATSGSGSAYIQGYLDQHVKNGDMTEEEAVALCKRAMELATNRDGASGGLIRLLTLSASGKREFTASLNAKKESTGILQGFALPDASKS